MQKSESYSIISQSKQLRVLFFILFSVVIFLLAYLFRHYYWPLLVALVIYATLRPLYDWLLKYIKKPVVASSVIVFVLISLFLIPFFFFFLALVDQTYQLYLMIQHKISLGILDEIQKSEIFNRIVTYFGIDQGEIVQKVTESLQRASIRIISGITAILSYPLSFTIKFFLMILMLFFLFKDGSRFASAFYKIMPFPDDVEKDVVERINSVVKVLMAGNFFIMVLQGLMVGVGLAFFGFGMPLLWGSVASILSLIPVVGTTFIWVPAVILLLMKGSYAAALILGIWCLFWYFILENLVKPVILGDRLNFHPLLFFFLLLGGIQTFGLPGVIVGPILMTLFYSLWEIYTLLNQYNASAGDDSKNVQREVNENGQ
ncbi:MAG TPA: AI-2E family transporter [Spirochaetota bacterium]|nr:AI-2E family transporter [Spirochaetota bacterium]HPI90247.1 AI-2E family transporter [Spirochaetota bacterium]HPR46512.1 AI-2E family transporter [Spirochaetota bacterium]